MQIQENIPLRQFNTFGMDVSARYFAVFSNAEELAECLSHFPRKRSSNVHSPAFILGGGSNVLFTKNYNGLLLKNAVKGIDLIKEDEHHVYVRAGAGENWHQLVSYCLQRNWAGVENLSLIPGNAGAAPMQNIGAYGVELKEVFDELEAFNLKDKKIYTLSLNDCQFGYRESIFKKKYSGQFVILNITLRLDKIPRFRISYGALREELEKMGVEMLTIQKIARAVIQIRTSKLPDPAEIGNAGSFFKNPVLKGKFFTELKKQYPKIPAYENPNGTVKLAAAWLIEQCGWRGYRKGDAGCHVKQPLVLVNYGKATGKEIFDLSEEILQSVQKKFNIALEREVNII